MKKHAGNKVLGALTILALGLSAQAQQQPAFTPGYLAVLQEGDGGTNRTATVPSPYPSDIFGSRQNPLFIDEFDPAGTNQLTPAYQVAIPTNGNQSLWINGNAGTEGNLTLSGDRSLLVFAGYSGDICSIQPGTAPSNLSYDRGIGTVDAFGNYAAPYIGGAWYGIATGKTNPRGAASDGSGHFWGCGNGYGSLYFDANTGYEPIQIQNITLTSCSKIINNALFDSVKGSESVNLYPAGIYSHVDFWNNPFPLPNAASFLNLFIAATPPYTNCIGFDISPDEQTAYVADNALGIQKYIKSGGSWKLAYNLAIPGYTNGVTGTLANPANTNVLVGAFSVTVDWTGASPAVFATTGDSAGYDPRDAKKGSLLYYGNRVIRINDTNTQADGSTIVATTNFTVVVVKAPVVSGATNTVVYKSVAFAPDLRPVIASNPASLSAVAGDDVTLTVAASSRTDLSYQWLKNGETVTVNGAAQQLILGNVQLADDNAAFQCVVSNAYGSATSSVAVLKVTSSASAPSLGSAQSITAYDSGNVTIKPALNGTDPKYNFQWYFNGTPLSDDANHAGTSTAVLSLMGLQTSDSGAYALSVANRAGSASNTVATLTVLLSPPIMIQPPQAATTFVGRNVTNTVSAYGSSLSYKWYTASKTGSSLKALSDSGEFSGTASDTLTITGASASDATNYVVVVKNQGGAITSAPAALSVLAVPAHTFASYTNAGQVYAQNFNSLPIPGGGSFDAANPQNLIVVTNIAAMATNIVYSDSKAGTTVIYSLDNPFDFGYPVVASGGIGGLGLGGTMPGWYGWTSGALRFGATSGDQSAGGIIENGVNYNNINGASMIALTNRALGLISTTKSGYVGLGLTLINKSSATLNTINVGFTAELWRNNPYQQPVAFGYVIDHAGTNTSFHPDTMSVTWLTNLAVAFQTNVQTVITDGHDATNQMSLAATAINVGNWLPGDALWLVWESQNPAGGAQDVAIDDLTFSAGSLVNFIYTSDNHYGIVRPIFQGGFNVPSQTVNEAMIDKMNVLPGLSFPSDGGLGAGQNIGHIDFLVATGDFANRSESQSAIAANHSLSYLGNTVDYPGNPAYTAPVSSVTWGQFQSDYLGDANTGNLAGGRLTLQDASGNGIPVFLSPGNHDINDAIGMSGKIASANVDPTSFVQIYNRMAKYNGKSAISASVFTPSANYTNYLINYSVDIGNVHFAFVNMFPDHNIQQWLNADLAKIPTTTPVFLFSHAPLNMAASETKIFGDPSAPTSSAAADIPFRLAGSNSPTSYADMNAAKQDVAEWLMSHPNVKALFSGHDNFNGATLWNGQDPNGNLISTNDSQWSGVQLFRVDSPMKGDVSGVSAANGIGDETKLSFQVYTLDTGSGMLTEREYLWNNTANAATSGAWSVQTATLDLALGTNIVPARIYSAAALTTQGGLSTLSASFRGAAGRTYTVETAPTVLGAWTTYTNIAAGPDGVFTFNPTVDKTTNAFYRVK